MCHTPGDQSSARQERDNRREGPVGSYGVAPPSGLSTELVRKSLPDDRRSAATLVIWRLALALLLSVSIGCAPAPTYTPEIAGVVTSRQELAGGSFLISLEDGRSHVVDTHTQRGVIGSGVPDVGDLLLAGTTPTPWVARLARRFDCFWIGGSGIEEGGYITADRGLRLREAANFDRGPYAGDEHEFHGGGFCVNSSGEVTGVIN
jgi:hypothetical protein